jgi:DNA-binding SARP family transcriptional activator
MEGMASSQKGQIEIPEGLPDPKRALAQVYLLGPIRIFRGHQRLEGGWRRKSLELLAYLAVHRDGVVKDQILDALWSETDPARSQRYFWQSASYLRCRLRGDAVDQRILWQVDDLYRLDHEEVWVDVRAFEKAIALSKWASHPESFLGFACHLYKGEFCQGRYYFWAALVQEELNQAFIRESRRLADHLRREAKLSQALHVLDNAARFDPYDEALCRAAMDIEGERDRIDSLVKRFRALRRRLVNELGTEPSPATVAVLRRHLYPIRQKDARE